MPSSAPALAFHSPSLPTFLSARSPPFARSLCLHPATALPSSAPPSPLRRRPPISSAAPKRKRSLAPTTVNRQARFRYEFLSTHECGVELLGTEIKSVRAGKLSLQEGYARVKDGQLWLHNVHISPCQFAGPAFNHDPLRPRRLLLHKRDIRKLADKQKDPGLTLVPTKSYFSPNGYLKVEIALARGKKLHDRRLDIKKREDDREIKRVVKQSVSRY